MQMTIDNIVNGKVEAKVATKDKGKKCAMPKIRNLTMCFLSLSVTHKHS